MRISDKQLDEFITLCRKKYGVELKRTEALGQLHKLVNLVMYMTFSEQEIHEIEQKLAIIE